MLPVLVCKSAMNACPIGELGLASSPVYCVQALPPEILHRIFVCFSKQVDLLDIRECDQGPTLLSHVCRTWRLVALRSSGLWVTISLQLKQWKVGSHASFTYLQTWLSRSADRPIDLRIILASPGDHANSLSYTSIPSYLTYLEHLWGSIVVHIHRCKHLHINLPPLLCQILNRIAIGLPNLEHLTICCGSSPYRSARSHTLDLSSCPRLQRLMCRDLLVQIERFSGGLNNLQYAELELGRDDICRILSQSPSLASCCIQVSSRSSSFSWPRLTLSRLHELRLIVDDQQGSSDQNLMLLIDHIYVPKLEVLVIDANFGGPSRSRLWTHINALILRSKAPVMKLDVMGSLAAYSTYSSDLLRLMHTCQDLRELWLSYISMGDEFWRAFSRKAEADREFVPLCPRLEVFGVAGATNAHLVYLADGIIARCANSGTPYSLRELNLDCSEFAMDDLLNISGIKNCIANGLNIVVAPCESEACETSPCSN